MRSDPKKTLLVASGLAIACVILFRFDPAVTRLYPPCPVHALTGWYCPGCGSLRGLHRLVHGDLAGAFSLNPLMVLSIPLIAWLLTKPRWAYHPRSPWILFWVITAYGILRNAPLWPFHLLAPH
ncbi:MAG: DUF2752 domain-containing protein [Fibrobacterota bacterium]|nr:MAG: DUF2752 domain-containing protein [Fibrobacterota bacterium]